MTAAPMKQRVAVLAMPKPSDKHRAWAELLRTAASLGILALAIMELGTKTGWW